LHQKQYASPVVLGPEDWSEFYDLDSHRMHLVRQSLVAQPLITHQIEVVRSEYSKLKAIDVA